MIIWFSLVAALFFGGHVRASQHMDVRNPQVTTPPSSSTTPSAEAPATTAAPGSTFFPTIWDPIGAVTLGQNAIFHYTFTENVDNAVIKNLVLCQTNATGAEALTSLNSWTVVQLPVTCANNTNGLCTFNVGAKEQASAIFETGFQSSTSNLGGFFLCWGMSTNGYLDGLTCESYSPFFDITPAGGAVSNNPSPPTVTPTAVLRLPNNIPVVGILGGPSSSASYATYSSGYVTMTASSSSSTPASATSNSNTTPISVAAGSSGLSTGALVGIIVGVVGGVLIVALLGLLCLRRRKRTRSNTMDSNQPEHVLLTQPYTSSFGSRDLVAEKDSPTTLDSILEAPLTRPAIPQNPRHSYDSLNASAPYSGVAAAAPKRKQPSPLPPSPVAQNAQSHSLLSRGISDASEPALARGLSDASGPISPRSARSSARSDGDDFEEYHDVPIYGDARHTPTVYQSHPSLQAPFLSEEGMSEDEIARLEEEERRIDAAIAEAERR